MAATGIEGVWALKEDGYWRTGSGGRAGIEVNRLTDRHCAPLSTTSNQPRLTFRSSGLIDTIAMMSTAKNGDCEVNRLPVQGIRSMH